VTCEEEEEELEEECLKTDGLLSILAFARAGSCTVPRGIQSGSRLPRPGPKGNYSIEILHTATTDLTHG